MDPAEAQNGQWVPAMPEPEIPDRCNDGQAHQMNADPCGYGVFLRRIKRSDGKSGGRRREQRDHYDDYSGGDLPSAPGHCPHSVAGLISGTVNGPSS